MRLGFSLPTAGAWAPPPNILRVAREAESLGYSSVWTFQRLLYALDTLGLAIFAALGAERGLSFGLGLWGTVFAGAVSGVGGGLLRDMLAGQIPGILYRSGDFYASAAALGALAVFVLTPPPGPRGARRRLAAVPRAPAGRGMRR